MSCDFVKSLTDEQKSELLKLLQEETPKYRVELEFWDDERTQIKSLSEYMGDQLHGKSLGWYRDGQKEFDDNWVNGQLHGKSFDWSPSGQLEREKHYHHGKQHGKSMGWHDNGQIECEIEWTNDNQHGKCVAWDENGRVISEEIWEHGRFVSKKNFI